MEKCKKCAKVISLDFADLVKGNIYPVEVTKDSIKKMLCKKCFEDRKGGIYEDNRI